MSEETLLVGAVVVGKRHDVRRSVGETRVAGTRKPGLGPKVEDVETRGIHHVVEPVVRVLVDEDQPKALMRLELQCSEKVLELLHATDRGDDEVERRKLLVHAP